MSFISSQSFMRLVTSGTGGWPISSASSSDFSAVITLYAAYIDVGGVVSSLKPQV